MLWPVLSTGLAIFLVVLEGFWLRTRNPIYYRQARFWARLYVLNFGIGVASGLPMEFQFGTNWAPLSEFAGDFFGSVLGFEGAMAFMLEAGFLGIMLFGWNRVPPVIHFLATVMVAFGANLSVFWILSANSWLQTPAGGFFSEGHFHVQNYFAAINNPFMLRSVLHMSLATVETSMLVVAAVSCWCWQATRAPCRWRNTSPPSWRRLRGFGTANPPAAPRPGVCWRARMRPPAGTAGAWRFRAASAGISRGAPRSAMSCAGSTAGRWINDHGWWACSSIPSG
jgi:cytochrome bd-type quinol oxidase subunit 1